DPRLLLRLAYCGGLWARVTGFQAAAGQGNLPGVVAQQWRTLHEKQIRANRLKRFGSDRLHSAGTDGGLGGMIGRGAGIGGVGAGGVVAWGSLGGCLAVPGSGGGRGGACRGVLGG